MLEQRCSCAQTHTVPSCHGLGTHTHTQQHAHINTHTRACTAHRHTTTLIKCPDRHTPWLRHNPPRPHPPQSSPTITPNLAVFRSETHTPIPTPPFSIPPAGSRELVVFMRITRIQEYCQAAGSLVVSLVKLGFGINYSSFISTCNG